uniref:Growth hormone releasing hormone receptor 2 n=1 Tax=Sinocyclocheilus rhinocerous TaxID=307959 RepID=A0A673GA88_9TELE
MDLIDGFIIWTLMVTCEGMKTVHPECSIVLHLQEKEAECQLQIGLTQSLFNYNATNTGCLVEWDGVNCWPAGQCRRESLSVLPTSSPQLITRTCTNEGWSRLSVSYYNACFQENSTEQEETGHTREYFARVKLIYTVGYGVSIGSLCIAVFIFCIFRKLLCTRTYIHLNLFSSFILRALAVFVKDAVLFADETVNHCTVSTVLCKAVVTFFQYCVLSNFYWLLTEGLYLQTLLAFTFTHTRTFFWCYILIGWGVPSVTVIIWTFFKHKYDNHGCWDDLDSGYWWIIKIPILLSVFAWLTLFFYKEYLFGFETLVFATLQIFFMHQELGFIVALLYCFLNCEVQNEIRKEIGKYKFRTDNNTFQMATQDFTA